MTRPTKGCDLFEFKCEICGKTVCTTCLGNWTYKFQKNKAARIQYCCSWSCLQAMRGGQKKKRSVTRAEELYKLFDEGLSRREIAEKTNLAMSTVKTWKEKYNLERGINE